MFFRKPRPAVRLATNPGVYPAPDGIHMDVNLVFATGEDAKAFLVANGLPTIVFERRVS